MIHTRDDDDNDVRLSSSLTPFSLRLPTTCPSILVVFAFEALRDSLAATDSAAGGESSGGSEQVRRDPVSEKVRKAGPLTD